MATADDHIQALLQLPVEDRANAAKLLLDSLDEEEEPADAEAEREAELARRLQSITDGTAELIDSDEVRRRVAAKLRAVRGQ